MKPTLEQISAFGLEIVEKEKVDYKNNKEYYSTRHAKRYTKQIVIYVADIFYNYNRSELASFFKISLNQVSQYLNKVRNERFKQDLADELHESLEYIYGEKKAKNKSLHIEQLLGIFSKENNFNMRSIGDLNKLEIWLLNRLYEKEN